MATYEMERQDIMRNTELKHNPVESLQTLGSVSPSADLPCAPFESGSDDPSGVFKLDEADFTAEV